MASSGTALIVAAVLALGVARAEDGPTETATPPLPPPSPAPSVGDELRPAFLQLFVNGVPGDTALVLFGGGDVWIAPGDLSRAGVSGFDGARRELEGRSLVSLRSLAPAVGFDLDEQALAVRLTAGPALLGWGALDLRPVMRPPGLEVGGEPSLFVNYAARATTSDQLSGSLEAGLSRGPALLLGSVSASRAGGVVRGLTALTVDDPRRLLRLTVGDAVIGADALSGGPVIGGVGLSRDLTLDPYLVTAPLPRATAFASTPSTVEVWVNGALARTLVVAPGTYDLSNLPVATGANDVRVVVRDAFGRAQAVEAAHYQAEGLLARGLHAWGWWGGVARERFGMESFDYRDPLLVGRHRYGFSERATGGVRLELGARVQQGAVSGAFALGRGQLEAAAAASADAGQGGAAAFLAWRLSLRRVGLGADVAALSSRYATSTLRASQDRALWRAGAFATLPITRGTSLQLRYLAAERRDGGPAHRLEARSSLRLAPRAWFGLSTSVEREGRAEPAVSVFAQLVLAAPGGSTVDAGVRGEPAGMGASSGAQRGLPPGTGVGYRVRADSGGGGGSFSGLVQAQPTFGRYEAGYDQVARSGGAFVAAAGGLVLAGGRLFATRPVEQSFALVRVAGVPGVRTFLDRQPVGKTDAAGDLLVPGLLPYYGNRLSIDDTDVPAAYRVGRTERLVAAPPRGGALVLFDVERLRAIEGWIRLSRAEGRVVPAFGTLELDVPGGTRRSPIAADGNFWLEDVPPGAHAARVYWQDAVCELPLVVPESSLGVQEVGELECPPRDAATPP